MISYERFDAWRAAHHLTLELYHATDAWPRSEQFGLTIQVRRAALSVPTNIAEGAAKRGSREFRRFLDIALGSLAELSYLLRFCRDYGLLTQEAWLALEAHRDHAGRLTWGLYHAVSNATEVSSQKPSVPSTA